MMTTSVGNRIEENEMVSKSLPVKRVISFEEFRYEPIEQMTSTIDRPMLINRVEEVFQTVGRVLERLGMTGA
jgi:hypothetical protein